MKIVDLTYWASWAALWVGLILAVGSLITGVLVHVAAS